MPRQPLLALGLLALALTLAPSARPATAQEPTKGGHAAAPAVDHPPAAAHAPTPAAHDDHAASPAAGHSESASGHAEGGAHAQPNILEPQAPLAVWTVVVFVVLLGVLGKFAWKPLIEALHNREEHLEHCLHEAEKARNEAEHFLAEHRRQMAKAADEVRAIIDEAKRDAQTTADGILRKAQEDSEAARDRAQRDIESAKDQALSEIWSKTADLAVSVAGRVLSSELGEADHKRLVAAAIKELPSANGHGDGGRLS